MSFARNYVIRRQFLSLATADRFGIRYSDSSVFVSDSMVLIVKLSYSPFVFTFDCFRPPFYNFLLDERFSSWWKFSSLTIIFVIFSFSCLLFSSYCYSSKPCSAVSLKQTQNLFRKFIQSINVKDVRSHQIINYEPGWEENFKDNWFSSSAAQLYSFLLSFKSLFSLFASFN